MNVSPIELVKESFLGFTAISDRTEEGLMTKILGTTESKEISINKCHVQEYDGAAIMSGVYAGVQEIAFKDMFVCFFKPKY